MFLQINSALEKWTVTAITFSRCGCGEQTTNVNKREYENQSSEKIIPRRRSPSQGVVLREAAIHSKADVKDNQH